MQNKTEFQNIAILGGKKVNSILKVRVNYFSKLGLGLIAYSKVRVNNFQKVRVRVNSIFKLRVKNFSKVKKISKGWKPVRPDNKCCSEFKS